MLAPVVLFVQLAKWKKTRRSKVIEVNKHKFDALGILSIMITRNPCDISLLDSCVRDN